MMRVPEAHMKELLDRHECYTLKRSGRFLVAALQTPHQVLSTSTCSGGMTDRVRFLVTTRAARGRAIWNVSNG